MNIGIEDLASYAGFFKNGEVSLRYSGNGDDCEDSCDDEDEGMMECDENGNLIDEDEDDEDYEDEDDEYYQEAEENYNGVVDHDD